MDRDVFIITVYCLVCEHYQAIVRDRPLRHGGFPPFDGRRGDHHRNLRRVFQMWHG
jgi:hypothetical protein